MNKLGHCTCCQQAVFDVITTHEGTGDRRIDGTPRQIGNPLPGATLVELVRSDGSRMKVTLCGVCTNLTTDKLLRMWKNICEQDALTLTDNGYRKARGGRALTEAQSQQASKTLCRRVNNPPFGVITSRLWKEIQNGSSR